MSAAWATLSVVVVSDNGLLRLAVRSILASLDIDSQKDADEAATAIRMLRRAESSIAIVDMQSPYRDGADAFVQSLLELPTAPRVITLRAGNRSPVVATTVEGGSAATVDQRVLNAAPEPAHLARAVLAILGTQSRPVHIPVARLTARQRQVLSLVAAGQSNTEIARRLHIASGTVKRHLNDTFSELQARSRLDAVNRARSLGLL